MISFSKFASATIEKGRRILKVMQFGAKTADEAAPFGDDSNPIKGMIAIYADTSEIGDPVILGYINENQLAGPGEKRLYSMKPDGSLGFYAWFKNDGTLILGGTTHNLVRYTPLNTGLQSQKNSINSELVKIQTAIASLGGVYAHVPVAIDISNSKINEIKSL